MTISRNDDEGILYLQRGTGGYGAGACDLDSL